MNRITQRHFTEESVKDLETLHDSLMTALGHRVPPTVTALYARPQVLAGGLVLWHSSFAGQPIAFKDLSEHASAELKETLFNRLNAIKHLADQESSRTEHDPRLLQLLRNASAAPPIEAIYSVGGQPVLLFWDQAITSALPREKLVAPLPPVLAATAPNGRRVWPWWLLGLLLLLALLWWLWCPRSPLNAVDPLTSLIASQPLIENKPESVNVPDPMPQAAITPPTVSPPEREPEPEPEPKPADSPVVDPEPVVEPEPEPVPEPVPEPPIVVPEPTPVTPPPKPKPIAKPPVTIDTAKNLCPADRPPALAPEMVVVFDASGSMMININASRQEELWAFSILNRGALAMQWLSPQERKRFEQLVSQPTRMMTAQQATINVLQRLPSDVSTGLVVVDDCPVSRNLGRYSPAQRGQMVQQLRGLSPRQGTPLADGILEAGRLVDGVNRESTILLVSDGGESCGGDPCMVARELARQKPHLKINVVDIGGSGAAACVATATGGKVYTVSNISELKVGLDRAAQDALGPSHCKK